MRIEVAKLCEMIIVDNIRKSECDHDVYFDFDELTVEDQYIHFFESSRESSDIPECSQIKTIKKGCDFPVQCMVLQSARPPYNSKGPLENI